MAAMVGFQPCHGSFCNTISPSPAVQSQAGSATRFWVLQIPENSCVFVTTRDNRKLRAVDLEIILIGSIFCQ
jgi:hypothetical protein